MQRTLEHASAAGRALGYDRFLAFVREFTDHANAGGERFENRVSPARRENRSGFLIDVLVCLREEARKLAFRRRGIFTYGDKKADLEARLRFLEREIMEHGQLFGNVLLGKFPIAHKPSGRKPQCTGQNGTGAS